MFQKTLEAKQGSGTRKGKGAREAASLTEGASGDSVGHRGVGAGVFRHRAWAVPGTLAVLSVRARGPQPRGQRWGRQGWLLEEASIMAAGGADRALALMPQQKQCQQLAATKPTD